MEIAVIIVRNSRGEFLVHRRSPTRKTYRGLYGLGAGGKLECEELPFVAARRELKEETGIEQTPNYLFSFDFKDASLNRLHVFETYSESFGKWDAREWEFCRWVTEEQVELLAASNELCPDTKVLFEMYRERRKTAG